MNIHKRIYEPVHGYIGLSEDEVDIVDSYPFQRLHYIHQNGPTYLVYPNANHTRFAHSLGCLSVMDRMTCKLKEKKAVTQDDIRLLRLAALLHDIGHYPFSHVISSWDSKKGKFPSHEDMARIVLDNTELKDYLSPKERNTIANIITGDIDIPIFRYLMTSDVDIDRIDYLLRDAYQTGVTYGGIDINRLVETINSDTDGLYFEEKGMQAVENFLLARYHMFQSVYNHRTSVAFRLLLKRTHEILVDNDLAFSADEIKSFNTLMWFDYNDNYLLNQMRENREKGGVLSEMIDDFFGRKPPQLVRRVGLYDQTPDSEPDSDSEYSKFLQLASDSEKETLAEMCGIDARWILYEEVSSEFLKPSAPEFMLRVKHETQFGDVVLPLGQLRPKFLEINQTELRIYTREKYVKKLKGPLRKYLKRLPDK